MSTWKKIGIGIIAAALCIFAAAPLFGKRYIPTHDGEYHIIRITEFSRMIQSGYLFPRWAPTLNNGYGVPVFEYNYPFPNYAGYVARLMTRDSVYAFQTAMGAGYLVLIAGIFAWLSVFFGFIPAVFGSVIGGFVPYLFVDLYIRGSIGEIWATAFLFILLFLIEKRKSSAISVVFCGLILSHNILALVYSPFILVYCSMKDRRQLLHLVLGAGLSAFFWIPALAERKYVQGLNTVNFREHFVQLYELLIPSWGSQFSGTGGVGNKISFQIGLAPLVSILLGIHTYVHTAVKRQKQVFWVLGLSFCIGLFFMSDYSGFFWEKLPLLANVQYPWRLLSYAVPLAAYSAAFWLHRVKRVFPGICLVVFAICVTYPYYHPVTYEPRNEKYYVSRSNFTDGTSSMGNSFSTVWTGWKRIKPRARMSLTNGIVIYKTVDRYLDKRMQVRMFSSGVLTPNILYFPGWRVKVDGKDVPILYKSDGEIHAALEPGEHMVQIMFDGTPVRKISDFISVICLVGLLSWGILHIYEYRH